MVEVFLAQFKDLLVIILIGAAAVSMLTGDPESAMVILRSCCKMQCWERSSTRRRKNPWTKLKAAFLAWKPGSCGTGAA